MIFIAGNSRSGTTLMGRILGKHPDIYTFGELHFLEQIWMPVNESNTIAKEKAIEIFAKLLSIQRDGYLQKRNTAKYLGEAAGVIQSLNKDKISFAFLYESFLNYETVNGHKNIPCEKTPRNVLYICELLKIYPQCKILCLMRDPKDVLLSQKKKWKRRFLGAHASIPLKESIRARINYHPSIISKLWNTNATAIEKFKNNPRVKLVKFEDLLHESEKEITGVCSFLQIPFHRQMMDVEQKGSSMEHDNAKDSRIDSSKTGHWKNGLNSTEIFICEKITNNMRQVFKYPDSGVAPSYILYAFYIFIFPFQLVLILIMNLARTKNVLQSIKKRFA